MRSELQIEIDRSACRGAGECVYRAPRTFALGEDERAIVKASSGEEARERILAAARSCPHFAIAVREDAARLV